MDFEPFVRQYQNMVYSTAMRLIGSESDAQDIAQMTFIKAWKSYSELADNPQAGGWLRTVTRNASINFIVRHKKRFVFFNNQQDDAVAHQSHENEVLAEEDNAWLHEKLEAIKEHLPRLPEAFRAPLVLYHYEDMSYEEIATALRISVTKVKSDIFRGRTKLRTAIQTLESANDRT